MNDYKNLTIVELLLAAQAEGKRVKAIKWVPNLRRAF